jgi:ABC-type transporter MlaC component
MLTLFPDLKLYVQKQISKRIEKSDAESKVYLELEKQFKLFIIRNYSKALDEYINREAKHADKEAMKDVLLSTLSITLNVNDSSGHKLTETDYLISVRNMIENFDS